MSNTNPASTIILHGLPASTFIGIDLLSLTSAQRFHGLSNVPPGPHFLYSAATTALSIRHGHWLFTRPSSLYVFLWESATETLQPAPEPLVATYRAQMADERSLLHQGLFPYSQPQPGSQDGETIFAAGVGEFARLTGRVTETLVKRILRTSDAARDHGESWWEISSTSCATKDQEKIPGLTAKEVEEVVGEHADLTFTNINLIQTWRAGATGRERTDGARDRSWALEEVVRLIEGSKSEGSKSEDSKSEDSKSEDSKSEDSKSGDNKSEASKIEASKIEASKIEASESEEDQSQKNSQKKNQEKNRKENQTKTQEESQDNREEKRLIRRDQEATSTWGAELLGEMQFVFLMILTLANYSCLEQWKRILALILTSGASIPRRADFFADFLSLLRLQLQHGNDVEDGLFDVADGGGDYLLALLKTFRRNLEEHAAQGPARRAHEEFAALQTWLQEEWSWDLSTEYLRKGIVELEDGEQVELEMDEMVGEDERGEYAPAVVDLSEDS